MPTAPSAWAGRILLLLDPLEAVEFPVYGRLEEDPRYFWQLVWKASPSLGEEGSPSLSELGEGAPHCCWTSAGGAAPLPPSAPRRGDPLWRSEPGQSTVPVAAGGREGRAPAGAPRRLHPRGILGGGRARLPLLPPSLAGGLPWDAPAASGSALGRRAGVKGSRRGAMPAPGQRRGSG